MPLVLRFNLKSLIYIINLNIQYFSFSFSLFFNWSIQSLSAFLPDAWELWKMLLHFSQVLWNFSWVGENLRNKSMFVTHFVILITKSVILSHFLWFCHTFCDLSHICDLSQTLWFCHKLCDLSHALWFVTNFVILSQTLWFCHKVCDLSHFLWFCHKVCDFVTNFVTFHSTVTFLFLL